MESNIFLPFNVLWDELIVLPSFFSFHCLSLSHITDRSNYLLPCWWWSWWTQRCTCDWEQLLHDPNNICDQEKSVLQGLWSLLCCGYLHLDLLKLRPSVLPKSIVATSKIIIDLDYCVTTAVCKARSIKGFFFFKLRKNVWVLYVCFVSKKNNIVWIF